MAWNDEFLSSLKQNISYYSVWDQPNWQRQDQKCKQLLAQKNQLLSLYPQIPKTLTLYFQTNPKCLAQPLLSQYCCLLSTVITGFIIAGISPSATECTGKAESDSLTTARLCWDAEWPLTGCDRYSQELIKQFCLGESTGVQLRDGVLMVGAMLPSRGGSWWAGWQNLWQSGQRDPRWAEQLC